MHFSISSLSSLRARTRRLASIVFLPILLLVGGCVSEPSAVTGQKQSFGYSWEQELQLGAEADKEITAEMGLYDNPAIQTYIESVGERLVQASGITDPSTPEMYRDTKFTFRVMDNPVVNAFALPGGYIYVTRGLLTHVQNEAQFAVVLGHEIAHVIARHSSQQARRAQLGQIGLIAGAILGQQVLGDQVGNMGQLLDIGGAALGLFMMRYSREAEYESDSLGVGYAQRAGYQAADSARFFTSLQRISETEGRALPTWQSTHPDPGDRANRVREIAAKTPTATGAAPALGEEQYLNLINGIVVGDNPREGFTRNNVFYHPELRFQFPVAPGWRVDNQKAAVVMAEPNGRALMGLRLTQAARATEAAAKFVEGAKIQVVARSDTQINGLPSTILVGQATTEQGPVAVWNAFIEYQGRVYSLLGYSAVPVYEQMRPTYEAVAGGFQPLRDPTVANIQPARLKIVRADRSAPFASFVPTSLPGDMTAEAVAIMNQLDLNEAVPPGRLLKIPDTSGATPAAGAAVVPTQQAYPQTGYPQAPPGASPPPPAGSYPPAYPPTGQTPQAVPPGYPAPQFPSASPTSPPSYPTQGYPPAGQPSPQPGAYPSAPNYPSTQPSGPPPTQWPR
jgi:predicted Zn-dependent protease